ncbi:MAG: hypothetical protein ABSG82_02510 [Sedimentisphaerales bacterium]|jgi:hypothetical protein
MNIKFMDVRSQNKTISLWFITLLVFFAIPQQVYSANEQQWIQVPEANYADVLELIVLRAKANYDEISSWQGRINIMETIHHYGMNAAEMVRVDKNVLKGDTQHICSIDKTVAEFAVDMREDKLYSSVKPAVQFKAVDLDQYVPLAKGIKISSRIRTVLTPDSWMSYEPDFNYAPKFHQGRPNKMVFINVPTEVKGGQNGEIRDPRIFFNSGGENKKLWDTLLQIKSNINERIKERVAGYPHIEISSLNTDKSIRYRILTTWRGGENYVMKYIRSLLEVDEAVGFNTTKVEVSSPDGVKLTSQQYTYEQIGEMYVPKTVKKEQRNNKGDITDTSEITIETTGINKPLPEDTFTIKNLGVEEDAIVTNNIKKAEFRYSKGNLVPIADTNE